MAILRIYTLPIWDFRLKFSFDHRELLRRLWQRWARTQQACEHGPWKLRLGQLCELRLETSGPADRAIERGPPDTPTKLRSRIALG